MISSFLLCLISNVIAGRWKDLFGIEEDTDVPGGRLITLFFRCVVPAIVVWENGGWYAALAALAGYVHWAVYKWAFVDKKYWPEKWHWWVLKIGLYFVPIVDGEPAYVARRNDLRTTIMLGVRGGYTLPAFLLFTASNPHALLWWLGTLSLGVCYWIGSFFGRYAVMVGEAISGTLLIFLMLKGAGL